MIVRSLILLFLMFSASLTLAAEVELEEITAEVRDGYIARAQVWRPTDVARMSIASGPRSKIAVRPEATVTCRYVEWDKPPTGATPKFNCKLKSGEVVRVKYGKNTKEIYAEVAATRLFWALGFYADEVYPVRLRCVGCPAENPFKPGPNERRTTRLLPYAMMERRFPGEIIEVKEDQGWQWDELGKVDAQQGGASRAQIDALKLLAVLVQHGDNKPEQQRLACETAELSDPDGDGKASCKKPILMVQDLGASFGRADFSSSAEAKMDFELWSEKQIWNNLKEADHYKRTEQRACFGNLTRSVAAEGGLEDPQISEEGRKFLAGLLAQLTDRQIRDVFRVARAGKMGESVKTDAGMRVVTTEDWVAAFKSKRDEITGRVCPD